MLYYLWRNEDTLLGSEQTYASKLYESEVHVIVEQNRARFETDADALSEALEALRNSEGNNLVHSFDSLNDPENEDLHLDMHSNYSNCDQESFNKQEASHLSSSSNSQLASILPTVACTFNQLRFLMNKTNNFYLTVRKIDFPRPPFSKTE